jgi:hypothetical protein
MLDLQARPIHPLSDPSNAGTKHLNDSLVLADNEAFAASFAVLKGCERLLAGFGADRAADVIQGRSG